MENTLKQLKAVESAKGTIAKKELLNEYLTDDQFRLSIDYLLNDDVRTGFTLATMKKELKSISSSDVSDYTTLDDVMNFVKNHNTGRKDDIRVVATFINQFETHGDTTLLKLLTKSLKLGITKKTVNAVVGYELIPEFVIQLAESFTKFGNRLSETDIVYVTTKLDGHRTVTLSNRETSSSDFRTRQGNVIDGLDDIEKELMNADFSMFDGDVVFDGECLIDETSKSKKHWFSETTQIMRKKGKKSNIKYHIFDVVPKSDFQSKTTTMLYSERRQLLDEFERLNPNLKHIEIVPVLYSGPYDVDAINDIYNKQIAQDEEGIMLNLDQPYQFKRTKSLLKMKPEKSGDFLVVGFEHGTVGTRNEHVLGRLMVDFDGQTVGIGSGLSDYDRKYIWEHQDEYLGKVIEVAYTDISVNKDTNDLNLRFPRFRGLRIDKSSDDVNIE